MPCWLGVVSSHQSLVLYSVQLRHDDHTLQCDRQVQIFPVACLFVLFFSVVTTPPFTVTLKHTYRSATRRELVTAVAVSDNAQAAHSYHVLGGIGTTMPCGHDVHTCAADCLAVYPAVWHENPIPPSAGNRRMDHSGQRRAVNSAVLRPIRCSSLPTMLLSLHFGTGDRLTKPNKAETRANSCSISSLQEPTLQRRRHV